MLPSTPLCAPLSPPGRRGGACQSTGVHAFSLYRPRISPPCSCPALSIEWRCHTARAHVAATMAAQPSKAFSPSWAAVSDPGSKPTRSLQLLHTPPNSCSHAPRTRHCAPPLLPERRAPDMQKCVRRRLGRDAVRVAHALLTASPADALRRIAVICIEDAVLHPQLPAVVWMMMAVAKGFILTADHSALAIRVVWDLAQTHVRDTLPQAAATQSNDAGAPLAPPPLQCRLNHPPLHVDAPVLAHAGLPGS